MIKSNQEELSAIRSSHESLGVTKSKRMRKRKMRKEAWEGEGTGIGRGRGSREREREREGEWERGDKSAVLIRHAFLRATRRVPNAGAGAKPGGLPPRPLERKRERERERE